MLFLCRAKRYQAVQEGSPHSPQDVLSAPPLFFDNSNRSRKRFTPNPDATNATRCNMKSKKRRRDHPLFIVRPSPVLSAFIGGHFAFCSPNTRRCRRPGRTVRIQTQTDRTEHTSNLLSVSPKLCTWPALWRL